MKYVGVAEGTTMLCEDCKAETTRRTPNQKFCTACSSKHNYAAKVASNREKRGQREDNGKPGFAWMWDYIRRAGDWEPSDAPIFSGLCRGSEFDGKVPRRRTSAFS